MAKSPSRNNLERARPVSTTVALRRLEKAYTQKCAELDALLAPPPERPQSPAAVLAQMDLIPKRTAFMAWCQERGLSIAEDRDAWGRRKFKHPHIESMWHGWFNALTEKENSK